MNKHQKLDRWADRELEREAKNAFLQVGSYYIAFGKYIITRQGPDFVVDDQTTVRTFSNSKTATSWCVADHYKQLVLSQRIYQLDQHRRRLRDDIRTRSAVGERSANSQLFDRVAAKLESRRDFLSGVDRELDKCVAKAKYLQSQGFEHETARFRHH